MVRKFVVRSVAVIVFVSIAATSLRVSTAEEDVEPLAEPEAAAPTEERMRQFEALVREIEGRASEEGSETGGAQAGQINDLETARVQIDMMQQTLVEVLAKQARTQSTLDDVTARNQSLKADLADAETEMTRLGDRLMALESENETLVDGTSTDGLDALKQSATEIEQTAHAEPVVASKDVDADADDEAAETITGEVGLTEIHFNPGSAELTPGGQRKVRAAAEQIKALDTDQIRVVGYSDTAGDATFNQKLSLRRADSIAAMLEEMGLERDTIEVIGSGEEGIPEPTEDGVAEPLNRCAGIFVVANMSAAAKTE